MISNRQLGTQVTGHKACLNFETGLETYPEMFDPRSAEESVSHTSFSASQRLCGSLSARISFLPRAGCANLTAIMKFVFTRIRVSFWRRPHHWGDAPA